MPRHCASLLKDPRREKFLFNQRVFYMTIGIGLLVLLLIIRLIYLQISQHQRYTTLARQNQLNVSPIVPNRGLIYDRNGILLAENVPVYNLVVTPSRVNDLQETIAELKKILPISDNELHQFKRQLKLHRQFEAIPLRIKLTEEEVAHFAVDQYRFPGVAIQAEMIRHYPFGDIFAPVIGYVGRINAKELATVDPGNYSATNFIGKIGVEKFYENKLHGTVGIQQAESDVHGQVIRVLNNTPPVSGDNLYLTIDSKLQEAAKKALAKQRGAVVAIDPSNGEVLALVSNPTYDPNLFVNGISKDDFKALQENKDEPLYNRALRGRFAPGSTVKPFIGLEGLTSGVLTPEYTVYDPGWFQLKGSSRIYHGYHRLSHGNVSLIKAIQVSSDVYFYNAALKLGIERLNDALLKFGFGKPTGIDLPDEASGVVPSPVWKKKHQGTSWYPGDTLISGIGQGFTLATPLQLAVGAAGLAMHGQRWQPHVLLNSQGANGVKTETNAVELPAVNATDRQWQVILTGMRAVVAEAGGTAQPYFRNVTYTVAGKTGTAQVFSLKKNQRYNSNMLPQRLRDNSLFICFAPTDKPRIALGIIVQNGAIPAAQVAREILDFYFMKKDIPANTKTISSSDSSAGNNDDDMTTAITDDNDDNTDIDNPDDEDNDEEE